MILNRIYKFLKRLKITKFKKFLRVYRNKMDSKMNYKVIEMFITLKLILEQLKIKKKCLKNIIKKTRSNLHKKLIHTRTNFEMNIKMKFLKEKI